MGSSRREGSREHRRRAQGSGVLYGLVAEHLETFLARTRESEHAPGLPRHVVRELRAYLRCGILAHGFARFHCFSCGADSLVAFSCKGRGFCPSCGGRRMAESAAHLVDHVFPRVPVRQWVISFPWPLRFLVARRPSLCRAVRRRCGGTDRVTRTAVRAIIASAAMAAVVAGLQALVPAPHGRLGSAVLELALPILAGMAAYVAMQAALGSPELRALRAKLRQ